MNQTQRSFEIRKQLFPKKQKQTKDSTFTDPYFFIKRPSKHLGTVNWDHFQGGLDIPDQELPAQMKHFENHLRRSQNEWRWRDSKPATSRALGRAMSQADPIRKPDYYFEERGQRHFPNWDGSWVLKQMN